MFRNIIFCCNYIFTKQRFLLCFIAFLPIWFFLATESLTYHEVKRYTHHTAQGVGEIVQLRFEEDIRIPIRMNLVANACLLGVSQDPAMKVMLQTRPFCDRNHFQVIEIQNANHDVYLYFEKPVNFYHISTFSIWGLFFFILFCMYVLYCCGLVVWRTSYHFLSLPLLCIIVCVGIYIIIVHKQYLLANIGSDMSVYWGGAFTQYMYGWTSKIDLRWTPRGKNYYSALMYLLGGLGVEGLSLEIAILFQMLLFFISGSLMSLLLKNLGCSKGFITVFCCLFFLDIIYLHNTLFILSENISLFFVVSILFLVERFLHTALSENRISDSVEKLMLLLTLLVVSVLLRPINIALLGGVFVILLFFILRGKLQFLLYLFCSIATLFLVGGIGLFINRVQSHGHLSGFTGGSWGNAMIVFCSIRQVLFVDQSKGSWLIGSPRTNQYIPRDICVRNNLFDQKRFQSDCKNIAMQCFHAYVVPAPFLYIGNALGGFFEEHSFPMGYHQNYSIRFLGNLSRYITMIMSMIFVVGSFCFSLHVVYNMAKGKLVSKSSLFIAFLFLSVLCFCILHLVFGIERRYFYNFYPLIWIGSFYLINGIALGRRKE